MGRVQDTVDTLRAADRYGDSTSGQISNSMTPPNTDALEPTAALLPSSTVAASAALGEIEVDREEVFKVLGLSLTGTGVPRAPMYRLALAVKVVRPFPRSTPP